MSRLRVDAVSLKLLNSNLLLVGLGNQLKCYVIINHERQETTAESEFIVPVVLKNKIHGIIIQNQEKPSESSNKHVIVIFGGCELVSLLFFDNKFTIISRTLIQDWIFAAHFFEGDGDLCFLTGHNIAQRVYVNTNEKKHILLERAWSEDSSTLYCAKICGDKWDRALIFAGTALGDILIWQPASGVDKNARALILHRLSGHRGVIFSIEVNFKCNLMTTTSDDRSVRFWKIENLPNQQLNFIPGVSAYGHTARVFNSAIICNGKSVLVASVGEDSNLCLWNEAGSLLYKNKINLGSTIWDLDYCNDNKTLYLSGSDGNVRAFELSNLGYSLNEIGINFEHPDDNLASDEYIAKIKILGHDHLIGLTNHDRLLLKINENSVWKFYSKLIYKGAFIEAYRNVFAVGGYQQVTFFRCNSDGTINLIRYFSAVNSMFRSLHFINESEAIFCDSRGQCFYLSPTEVLNFYLPKSKESWTTAALKIENFILLSDRCGNIHLFQINKENDIDLKQTFKNAHGNLGGTQMSLIVNNSDVFRFKTSGHEGKLKSFEVDKRTFRISLFYTEKIDVIWIERFFKNGSIVFGFNDKSFVVWNQKCSIVREVDCGGGHRFWDIKYIDDKETCYFVFVRNKKLYEARFAATVTGDSYFKFPIIKWHVKECNALKSAFLQNQKLLISGGEDNLIQITKLSNDDYGFEENNSYQQNSIYSHISNVRCLELLQLSKTEILLVSGGGRAQICASKIIMEDNQMVIKEIGEFMLKLSDFNRRKQGKTQKIQFDPETRFMCLSLTESKIYAGCSDGLIRELEYSINNNQFTVNIVNSINYGKCVLNVKYIESENILLTMATDGLICFWNSESATPTLLHKLQHHTSGVNAFDLYQKNENWCLITGGDDQSIALTTFSISSESPHIQIGTTIKSSSHHTAQVTGVKFINANLCCSISNDQIINVMSSDTLKISSTIFSPVSDVKGMHLLDDTTAVVYGSGVQIIKF